MAEEPVTHGPAEGHHSAAVEDRRRKLEALRRAGGVVFPTRWERRDEVAALVARFADLQPGEEATGEVHRLAGRLMTKRLHGKVSWMWATSWAPKAS